MLIPTHTRSVFNIDSYTFMLFFSPYLNPTEASCPKRLTADKAQLAADCFNGSAVMGIEIRHWSIGWQVWDLTNSNAGLVTY